MKHLDKFPEIKKLQETYAAASKVPKAYMERLDSIPEIPKLPPNILAAQSAWKKITEDQQKLAKLVVPTKNLATTEALKRLKKTISISKEAAEKFQKISFPAINFPTIIPDELREAIERLKAFERPWLSTELSKRLKEFGSLAKQLRNNPELQFASITELNLINAESTKSFLESLEKDNTDKYIEHKEIILSENLIPLLDNLGLTGLWVGAGQALEAKDNPEHLRHALVSLRTLLEHLIHVLLAPNDLVLQDNRFKEKKKITRADRIVYFTSKVDFGVFEEFSHKDINFICECYKTLCNLHEPDIGLSENQVKVLKVKTGVTIWLLAYLYVVINKDDAA